MDSVTKALYMNAMRAESIPEDCQGLWYVKKLDMSKAFLGVRMGKDVFIPSGIYTFLYRLTESTLHLDPPGEVVMEDSPFELQTHLGFVIGAYGDDLVTGLGLGCVIRGLLKNKKVRHVTCIEQSEDVIKLVGAFMSQERLTIIQADALEWTCKNEKRFDVAWHDLWTNREKGEPHLDIWHARILSNCRRFVIQQGAWAFDRQAKRKLLDRGFQWIG
jgi:hypothetical protein